jgi:hypothetical protein
VIVDINPFSYQEKGMGRVIVLTGTKNKFCKTLEKLN